MDDEEDFQRELKLMERKINSIKSNIEHIQLSNQRKRKQRSIINPPKHLQNNNNLFNKKHIMQTTPNSISSNKHEYKSLFGSDIFEKEKPLSLKRSPNTEYFSNETKHHSKEVTSLKKKFLSKERFKSFDNKNLLSNDLCMNYFPSSLSNRSIHNDRNNSISHSVNDISERRMNTTGDIIYSRNMKRGNKYNYLYTTTQESLTPRTELNRTDYHIRNKSTCNKNESYYTYNDIDSDIQDEQLIILEFERVLKDNKDKSNLINKAIALYEQSTGNILNDNMDIQNILYEWISKMSSSKNNTNKYKAYCETIMQKHNLHTFAEFQSLIDKALRSIQKKSAFISDIKKLLLLDNAYHSPYHSKSKYD